VTKNKVAPPFRTVEFDIMYGHGISREGDLLDLAVEAGLVDKRGSYYSFGDIQMGQGRENVREFLRQSPDIALRIENRVLGDAGLSPRLRVEAPAVEAPASDVSEANTVSTANRASQEIVQEA